MTKHERVAREIAEALNEEFRGVLDVGNVAVFLQPFLEREFPCAETTGYHMPVIDESKVLRAWDEEKPTVTCSTGNHQFDLTRSPSCHCGALQMREGSIVHRCLQEAGQE